MVPKLSIFDLYTKEEKNSTFGPLEGEMIDTCEVFTS